MSNETSLASLPDAVAPQLPEGLEGVENWGPHVIQNSRILVLPDIHAPYHNRAALELAVGCGVQHEAQTVLLNGDASDFFAISKFQPDPRKRNFANEVKTVRAMLAYVRQRFPHAEIIYKLGNHEERYEHFMIAKAPELLDVDVFQLEAMLEFEKHGITCVRNKRPIQAGDLIIIHGHEYKFAISNPVNPARGLFLRTKSHAMCSHFHQPSYHPEKTILDKRIATWSTGCLCDLHPEYMPFNNWSHGFAFIEVDGDGKFSVQNAVIAGGKIY